MCRETLDTADAWPELLSRMRPRKRGPPDSSELCGVVGARRHTVLVGPGGATAAPVRTFTRCTSSMIRAVPR